MKWDPWDGRCWRCGYVLFRSTAKCPECGADNDVSVKQRKLSAGACLVYYGSLLGIASIVAHLPVQLSYVASVFYPFTSDATVLASIFRLLSAVVLVVSASILSKGVMILLMKPIYYTLAMSLVLLFLLSLASNELLVLLWPQTALIIPVAYAVVVTGVAAQILLMFFALRIGVVLRRKALVICAAATIAIVLLASLFTQLIWPIGSAEPIITMGAMYEIDSILSLGKAIMVISTFSVLAVLMARLGKSATGERVGSNSENLRDGSQ